MLLERDGFDVADAGSATAGIERARELEPDLVLLDIQLPDVDGFATAERLARLEPAPPVILISSRAASDFGSLIARSTARGFIAKDELSGGAIRRLVPGLENGRLSRHA